MNTQQLTNILKRYNAGECTPAEKQLVDAWYEELINAGEWKWETGEKALVEAAIETRLLQSIAGPEPLAAPVHRVHFLRHKGWWAAAAILILFAGGAYYLFNQPKKEITVAKNGQPLQNDVAPGGNKAVLTLGNGATITLDSAHNGVLARQGNATVVKQNNGQLAYNTANEKPTEVLYNTLATPRGGQYQLVLPDGSKVWLNAASSIRYPTSFTGKQRSVDITGEAYFEVAPHAAMPFVVKMVSLSGNKGEVQVLGTRFNVNAYDDEGWVRTTLLEGSVLMKKDAATAILKPGQQAQVQNAAIKVVDDADIEQVMAWKNGLFNFQKADIQMVMRQVTRWYDVDVVYEDMPEGTFSGGVSRNTNLSNVLKILELNEVKFRIEGKKIIIKK